MQSKRTEEVHHELNAQKLPLADEKREGLTQNGGYLAESTAAISAGDDETAWEWLKYTEIPAYALMSMKISQGADFIRRKGLRTETAEAVYGKNW